MDIKLYNEYCTVVDAKGEVMVAQFFEKVRVETQQKLEHSKLIKDINPKYVRKVPEDGIVEKDVLYAYEDKVICPVETKEVTKVKLRVDKVEAKDIKTG